MSKKPSGAEFKRRAKEREKEARQSSSVLSSWLNVKDVNEEGGSSSSKDPEEHSIQEVCATGTRSERARSHQEQLQVPVTQVINEDEFQPCTVSEQHFTTTVGTSKAFFPDSTIPTKDLVQGEPAIDFDFRDPGKWPAAFSDSERCFIVSGLLNEGKVEPDLSNTSRDGRNLTKDWFTKTLAGGLKVRRTWLTYSQSKNALFCVPCKLFSYMFSEQKVSVLAKEEGFTQWKKLSERIPEHENSLNHKKCFCSWKTLELSLNKCSGINKTLQDQIAQEETHWRGVLYVIIDVIIHLAKQGSPLRGSDESLDFGDPRCGKFLNTIELVSHYHPQLREHILRHKKGQVSYFSPYIQNEFLEIIAGKIREHIVNDIKTSKYFSIMFDCTPDLSHFEQMSEVLRYVKITENGPEIVESFLDFIIVSEKTGLALSEEILEKLRNDGLDIKNCRGQSYDNGSNMAGVYKGVQSRIKEVNSLAYFVPCAAHSLNLVGANAASLSPEAESYFGQLNCLYNFFASSTNRWEVLVQHVPLSLKLQSNTRWSTKREAVAVIYKHLDKIIDALNDLVTSPITTAETKTEATSFLRNVRKFEFIVFSCFWYRELSRIDIVNKLLQRDNITIDLSAKHINRLISELGSERLNSSTNAIREAKEIAEKLNLDPHFKQVRGRKKKRMVDEKGEDESYEFSEEKKFRLLIIQIIDRILSELRQRFQAIQNMNSLFGFLNGALFETLNGEELKKQALDLATTYKEDLNRDELAIEVESFKYHALDLSPNMKTASPADLLPLIYKNGLEDAHPNIATALRIFCTIPVSTASNERSFSKLKIIKNYLRNLTGQQRLTNLSIISIEHKLVSKLSFEGIVKTFAAKRARKVKF